MTAIVIDLGAVRATRQAIADMPRPPRNITIAETIRFCLSHPEIISTWETEFLNSIRGQVQWGYQLSPKQLRVLGNILDKVEGAAADRGRAR